MKQANKKEKIRTKNKLISLVVLVLTIVIFQLQTGSGSVIFQDGFEFESGWSFGGPNNSWARGTPTIEPAAAHTGSFVIQTNPTGDYNFYENSWTETPPLDLKNYNNIVLTYWQYRQFKDCNDGTIVEISVNGGSTWTQVFPEGGYTETITSDTNPLGYVQGWCGDSTVWEQKAFLLSALDGQSNTKIRFHMGSDDKKVYNGFAMDDLLITGNYTDTDAPIITITDPTNGTYTNNFAKNVTGTIDDADTTISQAILRLNGVPTQINVTNLTFNQPITLLVGTNTISVTATDTFGNTGTSQTIAVVLDITNPAVNISSPLDGALVSDPNQTLAGTSDDLTIAEATVLINGSESTIPITNGNFSEPIALESGSNTIRVSLTDKANNTGFDEITLTLDPELPELTITSPPNNTWTNNNNQTINGTVNDTNVSSVELFINEISAGTTTVTSGVFTKGLTLSLGNNEIKAVGTNLIGKTGISPIVNVYVDTTPPSITISFPADGYSTGEQILIVTGTISDEDQQISQAALTLNGSPKQISVTSMTFSGSAVLEEGNNLIFVSATDKANNTGSSALVNVLYDASIPIITINFPIHGETYSNSQQTLAGAVNNLGITGVTLALNGITSAVPVTNGIFVENITLEEGGNTIKITATSPQGKTSSKEISVFLTTSSVLVNILSPKNGAVVDTDAITVTGLIDDTTIPNGTLTLNGDDYYLPITYGVFQKQIFLDPGLNTIVVSVTNSDNNTGTDMVTVDLNKTALVPSTNNPVAVDDDFIYAGNSGGQVKIYTKNDYNLFDVLNVCLGDKTRSLTVDHPSIYISCENDYLIYKYTKKYDSNGTIISFAIAPNNLVSWTSVSWLPATQDSNNTSLTVDLLNESGNPIQTNLSNGGLLDQNASVIKLRANMQSTDQFSTAVLDRWTIEYVIENQLFDTSSQTLSKLAPGEICIADIGSASPGDTIKITSAEISTEKIM